LLVLILPGASIPQAVNAGVRAASGDVIVRMDAHSTPAPDYISRALQLLQEPRAGVVGGIWDVAPGASTTMAAAIARAVSHPLGAGDAAYRTGQRGRRVTRLSTAADPRLPSESTARDVETVPFGCFTRAAWASLGGFDESLLTNEDYEFNHRAREHGLRVILHPDIRSTYYARPTLRALARQYFRYGWWKARMLRKHPGSLRWRQAVPAAFVAGIVALAIGGVLWRPAWWALGGVLAFYLAVLGLASALACAREGGWSRLPGMIAAFAAVHLAWGTGAVSSFVGDVVRRVRRTRPTAR
jgi:GT2 family glycosyltransferase